MAGFNNKSFEKSTLLTCTMCGRTSPFKKASKGCPVCQHHILKVAHRGNIEKSNPYYQMDDKDPYARQNDAPMGQNNGRGNKLTTPFDEETGGGLGTRFRGKGAPTDFSRNSKDTYKEQVQDDIPGSKDDLIQNPPKKDDLGGWFFDEGPFSVEQQNREKMKHPEQSTEGNLRKHRDSNNRLFPRFDDSLFSKVRRSQQGIRI